MIEDVLNRIEEMIIKGTEIALKENSNYDRWVVVSELLSNILGLCKGAILMSKDK